MKQRQSTGTKKVALVTGASSGIGLETARMLQAAGWTVYGTSRKIPQGEVALQDGIAMIYLDLFAEASPQAALALLLQREGRLDALVNNAGSGIAGAVEDTSEEEALIQFRANFFGTHNMCRAALPALRESRGIIVNMSSVAGVLSIPFQAMYSASKAALEAMTQALRLEVRGMGVRVTLVEPGDTRTGFTQARVLTRNQSERYRETLQNSVKRMEHDEQNGATAASVARVVCQLVHSKHPPVRKAVGVQYKLILLLNRFFPDFLREKIVALLYA